MRLPAMFVCLYVCLLAKLLNHACMDLDEILHVDRCRESGHGRTDQLLSPMRIIVRIQEPGLHRIFPFQQDYSKTRAYGFG